MSANIQEFRRAQLETNKLSNIGFAIGTDIGDPLGPFGMVHPRNKKLIGQRLSAAALSLSYDSRTTWRPPSFKAATATASATAAGGTTLTVTVTFANLPTGLVTAEDHCKTELKVDAKFCGGCGANATAEPHDCVRSRLPSAACNVHKEKTVDVSQRGDSRISRDLRKAIITKQQGAIAGCRRRF